MPESDSHRAVRVRFAPSPTGFLHIGGVRTALFNYLYARNQGGKFLLRIEDTDRERSKKEFEDQIIAGLKWLGLDWDEDLRRQMDRLAIYEEATKQLLDKGLAYQDPLGSPAIYLKIPKKIVFFYDLVHEKIEFDTNLFEDIVIRKSDRVPTFLFACVVDDIEMQITHVIRGDDHITNTARQLLIYESLERIPPKFAHLPLILNQESKPLSKREGGSSLDYYMHEGLLPEGLLNALALLGWGPGGNEEYFRKADLVKKFSIKRVNKTATILNLDKIRHINGLHMKGLKDDAYRAEVKLFYEREVKNVTAVSLEDFTRCAFLYQDRMKTFGDLLRDGKYFFGDVTEYDPEGMKKYATSDIKRVIAKYLEALNSVSFISVPDLETHLRTQAESLGIKAADLIHPLRLALTGKTVSPGIFDVMMLLGKERAIQRIKGFIAK